MSTMSITRYVVALGALTVGLSVIAAPALSAPLYPYGYQPPQVQQAPQVEEDTDAVEMLRQFFRGPQDLSFTDGAGEGAGMAWIGAGAHPARLYSLNWTRVLRPLGTVRSVLDRGGALWPTLKGVAGLVSVPGDFLLSKLPLTILRPPRSTFSSREVSAAQLFESIQEIGWNAPLNGLRNPYAQISLRAPAVL